jgi:hypothetical protein
VTTLATRSPEALRSLRQLQQSFLEPSSGIEKGTAVCQCYAHGPEGLNDCLRLHLRGWSSSADAIKQVHFARQLWDVTTCSLEETLRHIDDYRAKSKV